MGAINKFLEAEREIAELKKKIFFLRAENRKLRDAIPKAKDLLWGTRHEITSLFRGLTNREINDSFKGFDNLLKKLIKYLDKAG